MRPDDTKISIVSFHRAFPGAIPPARGWTFGGRYYPGGRAPVLRESTSYHPRSLVYFLTCWLKCDPGVDVFHEVDGALRESLSSPTICHGFWSTGTGIA